MQIAQKKTPCYNVKDLLPWHESRSKKRLDRQNRHHPTGLYPIGTWK